MNVLYLTNNPNLGSTARILQSWFAPGRAGGLRPAVVVPKPGDFSGWLAAHDIPHRIDPMPWANKRWPVPALWHAARVARFRVPAIVGTEAVLTWAVSGRHR